MGRLGCKSIQIHLCNKLPEESGRINKYQIQTEKTRTERNIEWRYIGSSDLATFLPLLVRVAINTLLVDNDCVIVKAGGEYLTKYGVSPVHSTD